MSWNQIWVELSMYASDAGSTRRVVMLGCVLLGISGGVLGTFALLRRQSLMGDAMAHAALPGVCLAFLLTGQKNTWFFLGGALLAGLLGAQCITWITRYSRIKSDTAMGLVLSVFFGVGILLLSVIQQSGVGNQSGLDTFLFGKAAFLLYRDIYTLAGMGILLLAVVTLFFKEFKVLTFDAGFAASLGLPVRFLDQLLTALIVSSVLIGLQVVGVILMSALLIIPAASARQWTDRLGLMCVIAALVGAFSGILGAFVSALLPKMPTGPVMVLAASFLFGFSLFFAPRRGLLPAWWRRVKSRQKIWEENWLKAFYQIGEKHNEIGGVVSRDTLLQWTSRPQRVLQRECERLQRKGWLEAVGEGWKLSPRGYEQACCVVRNHRLWELYLTRRADIAIDHVHRDAEEMEHFLSPALVEELEELLGRPGFDPHGQPIPAKHSTQTGDLHP